MRKAQHTERLCRDLRRGHTGENAEKERVGEAVAHTHESPG